MIIRAAAAADRDAIAALTGRTFEAHKALHPDSFSGDRPFQIDFLDELLAGRRSGAALVAEENGAVVGWTGLSIFDAPSGIDGRDVLGVVVDLTVAEAARERGVGTKLAAALTEWAKENGVTKLHADVWCGAPSSGPLERAGFASTHTVFEQRLAPPLPQKRSRFRVSNSALLAGLFAAIVVAAAARWLIDG